MPLVESAQVLGVLLVRVGIERIYLWAIVVEKVVSFHVWGVFLDEACDGWATLARFTLVEFFLERMIGMRIMCVVME